MGEKILVVLLRHKIKRKNKIIWHSGIDGESSSRLDKKLIMYSVEVLQKGSLKVCRMKAEAEVLGGCRDMKGKLTHCNTNQFFE